MESVGIPFAELIDDVGAVGGEVVTDPANLELRFDFTAGAYSLEYLAFGLPNMVLATMMKAILESGRPGFCQDFDDVVNVVVVTSHYPFAFPIRRAPVRSTAICTEMGPFAKLFLS